MSRKEVRSAEDWERFLLFGEKLPELKIIEVKQPDYTDHRHAELCKRNDGGVPTPRSSPTTRTRITQERRTMSDTRIFKSGEAVILHDGTDKRTSIELGVVGVDCGSSSQEVIVNFGYFNVAYDKKLVHKLPPTLKKALKKEGE